MTINIDPVILKAVENGHEGAANLAINQIFLQMTKLDLVIVALELAAGDKPENVSNGAALLCLLEKSKHLKAKKKELGI